MFYAILIPIAVASIVYILIETNRKPPEKLAGVYSQPGRWYGLKYVLASTLLWISHFKRKLLPNVVEVHMETMQSLSTHKNGFDAVFLEASSQSGVAFCAGLERHHDAKAQVLMYLQLPDVGLLEAEHLPRSIVAADLGQLIQFRKFKAAGVTLTPIEAMKKWHFHYKGAMRVQGKPGKIHQVELDGFFTNDEATYYLLDRDVDPFCLARALAREEWTDKYFMALKKHGQIHYEQMGTFCGTLTVDDNVQLLSMQAFRDHSYGYKRDWTRIHRYVYHILHLEDGTSISLGVACQPATFSELTIGFVTTTKLYPIQETDFSLHQHAEDGNPEMEYSFSITTSLGKHDVSIQVTHEAWHYRGPLQEAKVLQRFVTCQANGIRGSGMAEWHYNNRTK